tara:strand:- start:982 stop:1413 length:432 start_codon:yes stop_codon:yes gene_type:complete
LARPTKFKEEYIEQAKKLCSLGATTADLAEFFKVNPSTVKLWMVTNAKFSATINDQKAFSNAKVVRSLYERALGYTHDDVDIKVIDGVVVKTQTLKHYPPEPKAISLWLRNRDPDNWVEKKELEHGSEGVEQILKELSDKLPG